MEILKITDIISKKKCFLLSYIYILKNKKTDIDKTHFVTQICVNCKN